MDKLAHMEAFAAVAGSGSFAGAARHLKLANSVLSKRIKDLEDYLGVQLFHRTTRKVALTETGYAYLESVRRVLDEMGEVEARLRHRSETPMGEIRISAPLSFGVRYLGPAIASYLGKYDQVSIKAYLTDRRSDLLEEGFDLAIRVGRLEDSSLIAKRLATCRQVVCAAPAYFKRVGRPQTPADLKTHACLTYLNVAEGKAWPFLVKGKRRWQAVSGSFASDNGDLLLEAAVNACGITFLPTFIAGEALKSGRLETVLDAYVDPEFHIYAVYQHTRHLSGKVRSFIDHLVEVFKGLEVL